jgi:hypothetical protein
MLEKRVFRNVLDQLSPSWLRLELVAVGTAALDRAMLALSAPPYLEVPPITP